MSCDCKIFYIGFRGNYAYPVLLMHSSILTTSVCEAFAVLCFDVNCAVVILLPGVLAISGTPDGNFRGTDQC